MLAEDIGACYGNALLIHRVSEAKLGMLRSPPEVLGFMPPSHRGPGKLEGTVA